MDEFIKDKSLLNGKGENDNVKSWITIKGTHIPIKNGETQEEAIKKHFEEKEINKNQKEKNTMSIDEQKTKESKINNLESQVDKVLNGTYKDHHITLSEETPKILQEIGVPNKPLLMTAKHCYLAINKDGKYNGINDHYHDLGKETFVLIPKFLQSPIMVFKNHNAENEITAIINMVDKNKKPIIVPIKMDATGSKDHIIISVNLVKSTYGKNNIQNYIDKNVKVEDMLLIENKKIRNLNS